MIAIGIDVGGTSVRAAAVDADGNVLALRREDTPRSDDGDAMIRWIIDAVQGLLATDEPSGRTRAGASAYADGSRASGVQALADRGSAASRVAVDGLAGAMVPAVLAVALPGIVDVRAGTLVRSVNLTFLEGRPIAREIGAATGLRTVLVTDADAAVWGEYCARRPRPERFVHLRLGTGVACGAVNGGRLEPRDGDRSTHWPLLVVEDGPDARPCPCGLRGCLEAIASRPALEAAAFTTGCASGLAQLQVSWVKGDAAARRILGQAAAATTRAVHAVQSRFGANVICLGGGVIGAVPALFKETLRACREAATKTGRVASFNLEPARLGDEAGVIGAALLAMSACGKS